MERVIWNLLHLFFLKKNLFLRSFYKLVPFSETGKTLAAVGAFSQITFFIVIFLIMDFQTKKMGLADALAYLKLSFLLIVKDV